MKPRNRMSFSAPCSLSKFLRTWKTNEVKGIFPHGYYNKVEDLISVTFPEKAAFFDSIKKKNVDSELYDRVKSDYTRRLSLPEADPDKFWNMKCFLKHYNLLGKSRIKWQYIIYPIQTVDH